LQLAGLNPVAARTAFGLFLCSIHGLGKVNGTGDDCDNGAYWWSSSYWDAGAWKPYMVGVGDAIISQDGHVDGYSWGVGWPLPDPPPAPRMVSASKGLDWLRPLQDANTGGYGTPNDTLETLLAVVANGYSAHDWRRGPNSPSLLAAGMAAAQISQRADGAGKLAVAQVAAGGCEPVTAKGIMDHYDPATGWFDAGKNAGYQAWAIIGLRAISQPIPAKSVQVLRGAAHADGGWAYGAWSASSDTNGTALALQALIAAGEPTTSSAVVNGLAYLEQAQNTNGGFPWDPTSPWGTDSDTNSTALVVQGLIAAGQDPTTGTWKTATGDPISYLLSMQLADGGFEWQTGLGANQSATRQAIPALLGRAFPLATATLAPCQAAYLPTIRK
jgi:hypothetical protein